MALRGASRCGDEKEALIPWLRQADDLVFVDLVPYRAKPEHLACQDDWRLATLKQPICSGKLRVLTLLPRPAGVEN